MSPEIIAVFVLEAVASVFFGLWLGERRARLYIQNWQQYGTPNPLQRAVVTAPDEYGSPELDAMGVQRIDGRLRLVRDEDAQPAFDEKTVENGVEYLLAEARARGEQLSEAEARDEAIRMLNAEGPEML